MAETRPVCRVGVDIGGTFTDIVALTERGRAAVVKVASTPDDYGRGVLRGLADALAELDLPAAGVAEIVHGFTVATNAILEGKGAAMALITTEGFRDVLEIARLRTPRLYDLTYRKPPPLVERRLRLEVRERVDARGRVLAPLDAGDVERAVAAVREAGVPSVAVSLLHSYANPSHEQRIGDALRAELPALDVSLSSELLPEAREYERTSTTVINGYIRPVVERYLQRLVAELRRAGTDAPVTVMQSNGGLMPVELAARKPMYCIESGPAAGVIGAAEMGARLGQSELISFDMGGTTAKASIVEGGKVLLAPEYEVGGGMNAGHRLLRGAGYVLRVPTIDIAEVSAGGGSIAWVDRAGGLQIGPHSAGAVPGPVCYGAGGTEPTVSDADVALGFLNPEHLLGGAFPIDAERARAAVRERLAEPAGLAETEAAWGVHTLANVKMGGALRAVSSERGRDPRRFAMIAFGGSGPVHAAGLASSLGIGRVIVPPSPGVFSAFGLLFAEVEHHFVQTLNQPLAAIDVERVNAILDRIGGECRTLLDREGFDAAPAAADPDRRQVRGPDLRAHRRPAGRALQHRGAAGDRGGVHARAPAHLRLQRRGAGAGREPAGDRSRRRAPGPFASRPRPRRRPAHHGPGAPAGRPPRLLRSRPRLAVHARGRPSRPALRRHRRPADRRGIRLDHGGAARMARGRGRSRLHDPGGRAMTDPSTPRDPVTREVIRSSLVSAADSMAVTVVRTARSAVVKDGMDFSTAVFNAAGEQVAQGLTLPFHMGAMQPALDGVLAQFEGDVEPGDILASNDPYSGASHLPDIFLFKPVFAGRTLIAWLCVIAHHTDIGGRVAGGNACDNTEIYQEGLRLPPLKLFAAGQRNDAVWRIIGTNVRVPSLVHGDLLAQVAALEQGEQDLLALAADHGIDRLHGYMTDIIEHTERRTRAEIAALPDGSWSFSDFIDGDGIRPEPIEIRVRVTIAADELTADFAGTSPQATGSINPNLPYTTSAVYAVLKTLTDPSIDANAGFFRPIAVRAPPGCFVNPQHPAAVAARGLGGFRIAQAVFGALAKALPDRVPAAWGGGEFGVSFGGYYPDGRAFVFLEFNNDGPRGGGPLADGADGLTAPVHNMANTPIETIEAAQPLLIRRYGFVPDTGGPGRFRGGLGLVREYELTHDEATLQIRSDRAKFLPWGTQGGSSGSASGNLLNPDRGDGGERLPGKFLRTLKRGDVYRLVQPGGGGYGDPLERDPEAVREDAAQGKITAAHARESYGVVLDEAGRVDTAATAALRDRRKRERGPLATEPRVRRADDA